ncbi:hypothetical protein GE061_013731 [Apolygus lucorum]|uniref:Uncharacterized protein n=1 Tax=Apolygus lucorum TaxID=248454 RepID=A0A6A4K9S1_APOLU|nr:hypothetical protein GE061_013731 [Apolygus lucorum]
MYHGVLCGLTRVTSRSGESRQIKGGRDGGGGQGPPPSDSATQDPVRSRTSVPAGSVLRRTIFFFLDQEHPSEDTMEGGMDLKMNLIVGEPSRTSHPGLSTALPRC